MLSALSHRLGIRMRIRTFSFSSSSSSSSGTFDYVAAIATAKLYRENLAKTSDYLGSTSQLARTARCFKVRADSSGLRKPSHQHRDWRRGEHQSIITKTHFSKNPNPNARPNPKLPRVNVKLQHCFPLSPACETDTEVSVRPGAGYESCDGR